MSICSFVPSGITLLVSALLALGCDAINTNQLTVKVQVQGSGATAEGLVVESRWLKDSSPILKAGKAEEVRIPFGHEPTADWPCAKKAVPGVPVMEGEVQLDFSYAVGWFSSSFRPLDATWLAVWKLPREEWVPQEFLIVKGKDGTEIRRLVREKSRGSLGAVVGIPENQTSGSSATRAWRVVLPLAPWIRRKS